MSTRYTAYAGRELLIIVGVSLTVAIVLNAAKIVVSLGWVQ